MSDLTVTALGFLLFALIVFMGASIVLAAFITGCALLAIVLITGRATVR